MGPASINGFPLELGVRGVGGGTLDAECVEVNPNGRYIRVSSLCLTPYPQARQFIEKCLVSAAKRLPAKELLKDPFLQINSTKEPPTDPIQVPNNIQNMENPISRPLSMDIDSDYKSVPTSTGTENSNLTALTPALEFQRTNRNNEFKLKGQKIDDNSVSLILRIADTHDLSDYDVVFIADFIDFLIMKFVPGWIPSTDHSSSENISPCKQYDAYDNNELHSECPSNTLKSSADFGRSYDHAELSQLNLGQFAEVVDGISYKKMDEALATAGCNLLWSGVDGADKGSHMSANSLVSGSTKSLSEYTTDVDSKGDRGVGEIAEELPLSGNVNNLEPSIYHVGEHRSSSCSSKASSSLSLTDKDQCELRAELDMIETQYQRCFYELSRMREEAMENARKRWFARKSGG
ncbi:hypothetical protein B296_00015045 [Ensete ventricosum]|uniref:non-specific serine/threonine protein kinase n=1 Tax=Ensete ventricosum TaxID=4639 RepID=A0A426ZCK8_ENSVE|nr:hypothetical protein B296_00015045 [Ensete ventricosum]